MKRIIIIMMVALFGMTMLSSCDPDFKTWNPRGTWNLVSSTGYNQVTGTTTKTPFSKTFTNQERLDFENDGVLFVYSYSAAAGWQKDHVQGSWEVSGDEVQITYTDPSTNMPVTLSGQFKQLDSKQMVVDYETVNITASSSVYTMDERTYTKVSE